MFPISNNQYLTSTQCAIVFSANAGGAIFVPSTLAAPSIIVVAAVGPAGPKHFLKKIRVFAVTVANV